uniref:Uncharacterized protein n=1 Tax=Nelumbo nucifera TaxID=4432 RepID=A0A822YWN5_NELNU|nr:TPA_asm: hypothetical protein HUJ06_006195 [Nelumbo nucifera]
MLHLPTLNTQIPTSAKFKDAKTRLKFPTYWVLSSILVAYAQPYGTGMKMAIHGSPITAIGSRKQRAS